MATLELQPLPPRPAGGPEPDPAQERVIEHRRGPLLVLAGPGTGKTTTLVEAVARRVGRGTAPDRILVLTFSRRAALELRERIGLRLAVTRAAPAAWTFHAYCLALVRSQGDPSDVTGPLRLLTGPQQQAAVRELLAGDAADSGRRWPESLRACLRTRGLAEELRDLMARTRALGLDPAGLAERAEAAGRGDWAAAAVFFEQYLQVLDLQGLVDYGELVHRAAAIAADLDVQATLRASFDAVFVDEYQDTDPAQERLLQALAGDGRDLVAVGDPDQAIYGFRGADVHGLLSFPHRFRTGAGDPAPVATLRVCRRSGPDLLKLSRAVAARIPATGLPAAAVLAHRDLEAVAGRTAGTAEVRVFGSAAAQASGVADLLRRAHLQDGLAWDRMAVLVRSAARSLPLLRRVLGAAGVPVVAAGDELPLSAEPAVAPLLVALRVADDPALLDADTARVLLISPLVGADPARLRRLGRSLRSRQRAAAPAGGPQLAGPSSELIGAAVADPELVVGLPAALAEPVRRLAALLAGARGELAAGRGAEAALWALWSGCGWPARLEGAALAGGVAGQAADRDLDAVLALFDAARRYADLHPGAGVPGFAEELLAQEIPADTLSERGVRAAGVRVLTAHRSKGLEWDLVVVCGVQEGQWPDLRRRGSLLEPDRLGSQGVVAPASRSELLVEERRLFYVAVTRARERLVLTAVASPEEDGQRPSRFLDELGLAVPAVAEAAPVPLTLPALVARLRHSAVDPAATPQLRAAATQRLARLAVARGSDGSVLVPAADPEHWWGLAASTEAARSPYPGDEPVALSGTSLERLQRCPLQWLLEHEIGADASTSPALGIGRLLHQLAEDVAVGRRSAQLAELGRAVDQVWGGLVFEAPWIADQQRDSVRLGLERLVAWLARPDGRWTEGVEVGFEVELALPSGRVVLRGRADRVELDADGRVWVVDLKTGRAAATGPEVAGHAQLGIYQLAVLRGALPGVPPTPGGAQLLQLRAGDQPQPLVQTQEPLVAEADGLTWVERLLEAAVARLHAEDFPPAPGTHCTRCRMQPVCPAQPEGQPVIA
jgi:superfamily I DNA/RNA helicase/RecB family exonuclease